MALNAMLLEATATSSCRSASTVPALRPTALTEEEEADPQFMPPNVRAEPPAEAGTVRLG
jgi:hypothetical protein